MTQIFCILVKLISFNSNRSPPILKLNVPNKSKKVVRYSSDFIRKQNFGFFNSQLLGETDLIKRNYSKILKVSSNKY